MSSCLVDSDGKAHVWTAAAAPVDGVIVTVYILKVFIPQSESDE